MGVQRRWETKAMAAASLLGTAGSPGGVAGEVGLLRHFALREERDRGERRNPRRPPPPPAPPRTMGTSSSRWKRGFPQQRSRTSSMATAPTSTATKRQTTTTTPGLGLEEGCAAGRDGYPVTQQRPPGCLCHPPTYCQPAAPGRKGGARNTPPKWMGRDLGLSKGTEASPLWDTQPPNRGNVGAPVGTGIHGSTQRHPSTSSPHTQHGKGQRAEHCAAPQIPPRGAHPGCRPRAAVQCWS